jgi:ubiquinone/menaquinone biosynthesis C-methylase UbiE
VPVIVAGDDGQSLTFPDDRFDAALCTRVPCGIPDPGAALAEVARVLEPGAALHFVEHGARTRSRRRPVAATRQLGQPGGLRVRARQRRPLAPGRLAPDSDSDETVTAMNEHYEPAAPKTAGFMYEARATT